MKLNEDDRVDGWLHRFSGVCVVQSVNTERQERRVPAVCVILVACWVLD